MELVVIDQYEIATMDGDIGEIIEENLGGDGIGAQDLTRIKIPSGGGTSWSIPVGGDEEDSVKHIDGIVLFTQNQRVFWEEDFSGGGTPPDCFAEDGKVGSGDPGVKCTACPHSKFGTAKGGAGRGQACTQKHALFVLQPKGILPLVINIPPTSLKSSKEYMLDLISNQKRISSVVTRLSLRKEKNNDGMEYSKVVFENLGDVEHPEIVKTYLDAIKPYLVNAASEINQAQEDFTV